MATIITWPMVSDKLKEITESVLMAHKTKVIPRQLLGLGDEKSDATLFRSQADGNRINALLFWRGAALPQSSRHRVSSGPRPVAQLARQTRQGQLLVQEWTVQFRLYLAYASGTNADNSQETFDAIVDALTQGLAARPTLGLASELFDGMSEVAWTSLSVEQYGDVAVHQGLASLAITILIPVTVNP